MYVYIRDAAYVPAAPNLSAWPVTATTASSVRCPFPPSSRGPVTTTRTGVRAAASRREPRRGREEDSLVDARVVVASMHVDKS